MIYKISKIKISLLAFFFINTFMFLTIFIEDNSFMIGMESGISEHLSAFLFFSFYFIFWTLSLINKIVSAYSLYFC